MRASACATHACAQALCIEGLGCSGSALATCLTSAACAAPEPRTAAILRLDACGLVLDMRAKHVAPHTFRAQMGKKLDNRGRGATFLGIRAGQWRADSRWLHAAASAT